MRCMACGEAMRLIGAVADEGMFVAGYERHTLHCPACRESEERLVFRVAGSAPLEVHAECPPAPAEIVQQPSAVAQAPAPAAQEPVAQASRAVGAAPMKKPQAPTAAKPRTAMPAARAKAPIVRPRNSGAWERAIESLRSHERDLDRRAQLAPRAADFTRAASATPSTRPQPSAFDTFWEELIPRTAPTKVPSKAIAPTKPPMKPLPMKPLPRAMSLAVVAPGGPLSRWARAKALLRAREINAANARGPGTGENKTAGTPAAL